MPGQNLGVYDPDKTFTTVSNLTIQGYGAEQLIRTERTNPKEFLSIVGAQGDWTFQKNLDKSGLIIITLAKLSPSNTFLQSLLEGETIFPVEIRQQHNYIELVRATSCMVNERPRIVHGKTADDYEWMVAAGQLIETAKAA